MPKNLTPQDQWETEFEMPIPGEPRNIGPLETLFQRLLNRTERLKSRIGAIIGGSWDSTPPDTLTGLDARVDSHRTATPIDHPDGSVALSKLDPAILGQPNGLALLNATGMPITASGTPVVAYGSNGNGSYVRYADGTQICWHVGLAGPSPQTWFFPAAFAENPSVFVFSLDWPPAVFSTGGFDNTHHLIRKWDLDGSEYSGLYWGIYVMAIGRWF